jgi:hypothetical protein
LRGKDDSFILFIFSLPQHNRTSIITITVLSQNAFNGLSTELHCRCTIHIIHHICTWLSFVFASQTVMRSNRWQSVGWSSAADRFLWLRGLELLFLHSSTISHSIFWELARFYCTRAADPLYVAQFSLCWLCFVFCRGIPFFIMEDVNFRSQLDNQSVPYISAELLKAVF